MGDQTADPTPATMTVHSAERVIHTVLPKVLAFIAATSNAASSNVPSRSPR